MTTTPARAFILVMDSFGLGGAKDAAAFGDEGANTLASIAKHYDLFLPNLTKLGLAQAAKISCGLTPRGLDETIEPAAIYGAAAPVSHGKDTPSGHWEMAGLPVEFDWGYFPDTSPTFPKALIKEICDQAGLTGILGDCHESGTKIIARLGAKHIKSGLPIFYSSADSVLQIAAHEENFGLQRLYDLCQIAFAACKPYNIARVIARPFSGDNADNFTRTSNRKDYTVPPHGDTLLDIIDKAGYKTISVGKIADIFAHRAIHHQYKAGDHAGLMQKTIEASMRFQEPALIFTNFVDFDMKYGHRRDIAGYGAALNQFDAMLPAFFAAMQENDMAIITADHGCDPAWPGSDHTRENVPILCFGKHIRPNNIGLRHSFADIGQTIASHLHIPPCTFGTSFL